MCVEGYAVGSEAGGPLLGFQMRSPSVRPSVAFTITLILQETQGVVNEFRTRLQPHLQCRIRMQCREWPASPLSYRLLCTDFHLGNSEICRRT